MLKLRMAAAVGAACAMLAITAFDAGPASAGGGCHRGSRDERGTAVAMSENCFTASVLRVDVGDTVTWHNKDEVEHTVTGADVRSGRGWGDFEPILGGEQVSYTFDESGIFLYYCQLHPGMVGAIVVGDGQRASAGVGESAQSVSAASAGSGSGAEPDETAAASVPVEGAGPGLGQALAIVGGGIAALGVVALTLTRVRRRIA